MYEILAAIDEDADGVGAQIDAIGEIADASDEVVVHLLHVFTDNPTGASVTQVESAREAIKRLEERGITVHAEETSGDPATQVLEHAEREDVDQICVGGRKRSPTGKALFGSVTQDVILGTERPVLVCGRGSGS
ncbi:Universal stress protein family protein [Halorubrum aquaticum]|uniref:Universal stress protein family protein n=1 Tax=Halorubrum aquaticum TaxID=387340 RepID=A0A1I3A1H5_9EURY|nr:universal stress protein [Halorubrum aquaticum]SFH43589.1 Universal stress protein family protein [Halorubrum aquaticum]